MNPKIDTMRLRILQTKCMTVSEIAETMGVSPEDVADSLNRMGYTPIYMHDVPEQYTYKTKNEEENTMPRGERTPVEKIHEISVLRDEGKSQNKIAEITGVPVSTVGKICARLGKAETKEEPAPSANDTSSKENISINSIAEIPADVNPADEIAGSDGFCCEVTGDTDMEAYMAEREKDLAASKSVPTIVWEACMEKMEELRRKIKAAQDDIAEWAKEIDEISAFLAENTIPSADEEGRE